MPATDAPAANRATIAGIAGERYDSAPLTFDIPIGVSRPEAPHRQFLCPQVGM